MKPLRMSIYDKFYKLENNTELIDDDLYHKPVCYKLDKYVILIRYTCYNTKQHI